MFSGILFAICNMPMQCIVKQLYILLQMLFLFAMLFVIAIINRKRNDGK